MLQITVQISGMACSMCEAHVNDAVRKAFLVKKVTSSHSKGQTVILTEQEIDAQQLKAVVAAAGYEVESVRTAPFEKKGLFSAFRK